MAKLTSTHHKWFISILVIIVFSSSLLFGIDAKGKYLSHNFDVMNMSLLFVNTALLIVIAAILVKIEDDLNTHHTTSEAFHMEHSKKLNVLTGKKR